MGYRKGAARKAGSDGGNAAKYQEITDRIVAALEAGTVPWHQPWTAAGGPALSMSTNKRYRGINTWLLALTAMEQGYASPYWATYNKIKELGGQVRKGEHGTFITFWKELRVTETDAATGEKVSKSIPLLKLYTVFNAEQADGLPERFYPKPGEHQPIASAQQVLDSYLNGDESATLLHDVHGEAYYSHLTDEIHMPPLAEHETSERYYSTAFHETVHSTGHHSRLARRQEGELRAFGSHDYGTEELAAEMGAAMLAAETGIETEHTFEQSAAYLASWIHTIREDTKMVVKAASAAQKSVDLVLGRSDHDIADDSERELAAVAA